jgi:carbon dioxide concentrating mechanism protein CcmM
MGPTSLIILIPLLLATTILPAQAAARSSGRCEGMLIDRDQLVVGDSFVAPLVEIFGDVYIGGRSFVAGNTIVGAAPDRLVCVGSETNLQDNIIVRSLGKSIDIGDQTSLAHHGIVRDSEVGDFVFIGFNAQVSNSVIEDGAFILHGAYIEGVTIPENRMVGIGQVVLTQEEADALPEALEITEEFRREVLDVNAEFASSYINLYYTEGYESLISIGPNPVTSFNPEPLLPHIGENVELQEFVRVVGDVRLGANSKVDQRTAIRADEGSPIVIGAHADIDDRVTFHALKGTDIRIGDKLTAQDDIVFHGPLVLGNNISVEDDAVIFRVNVEDNVKIGERALVVGPAPEGGRNLLKIPAGTVIPDEAVITSEEDLRDVLRGGDGSRDEDRDSIPVCSACQRPNAGRAAK